MDDEKYLRIALKLLKINFKKDREKLGGLFGADKREIGNASQETGVSREDLKGFFQRLLSEMVEETFAE